MTFQFQILDGGNGIGHQIAMRKHDSFGIAGTARCIENGGKIIGTLIYALEERIGIDFLIQFIR